MSRASTPRPPNAIRIRPLARLLRQGLVAATAFFVPVFVVLYFLTVPYGPWVTVLIIQVFVSALIATAYVLYRRVAVWVSPCGVTERGFFGLENHLGIDEIGSIVLVQTYHGGGVETTPQLFVSDKSERRAIRMRGQFWSLEMMDLVRSTLKVPVTELTESLSSRELHARYPDLVYWFERRPVIAVLAFTVGVVVAGVAIFAGLELLGITSTPK
ncbi:MAG: hypothetical protein JWM51_1168 [Microbacteriaceae bacterium]|nr:hypothetical protein [Microbacteriaceae bacterium]